MSDAALAWYAEVVEAAWTGDKDVASRYPRAEFDDGDRVLFDLGGGEHCAVVRVSYPKRLVLIEFIGARPLAGWPVRRSHAGRTRR